jgi:hypothetical protein
MGVAADMGSRQGLIVGKFTLCRQYFTPSAQVTGGADKGGEAGSKTMGVSHKINAGQSFAEAAVNSIESSDNVTQRSLSPGR